jgi:hypothetical protein
MQTVSEAPFERDETTQEPVVADYWGTDDDRRKWYFPDGVQYIEFKIMNEGDKAKFQRMTSQNLTVSRQGDATVRMDPAKERHELITNSVTGWYMFKGGEYVAYGPQLLTKWLQVAPPKLVEDLEFAIREANPWMQADMTVDQIDEELTRLGRLRDAAVAREVGEGRSANR